MKHIKNRKVFEALEDEVIEDLKDILLDLDDTGEFQTSVEDPEAPTLHITHKDIIDAGGIRYISDITKTLFNETVERIKTYMKSKGYDNTIVHRSPLHCEIGIIFWPPNHTNNKGSRWWQITKIGESFGKGKYHTVENYVEIIYTIKDICIELEDKGFKVTYDMCKNGTSDIGINISKDNTGRDAFKFGDIKDVLERLKDYMGQNQHESSKGKLGNVKFTSVPRHSWLSNDDDLYRSICIIIQLK